ncbi:MAG: aminomethyl-transferring glycine dehydrogenase, partial [Vicinamibacteria bacterium]|nr:aminomethyl-transferring glycine dehydrogenase [Vicinamibacteria bacterium]
MSGEAMSRFLPSDTFPRRHLGPSEAEIGAMLKTIGVQSLDQLIDETVPDAIRLRRPLDLDAGQSESAAARELARLAGRNQIFRNYIGLGYSDCLTPAVIARNILENPGWYTQYTPYQAEIAQGRLEALLNFQTMVAELTALPLANASLLDEATAAAEAMHMCRALSRKSGDAFAIAAECHPQTIAVLETRARPLGYATEVAAQDEIDLANPRLFGVLVQNPTTDGRLLDLTDFIRRAHEQSVLVIVAADLLALALAQPPGEQGADVAVGSCQRFGLPLGFGGPHAAFMATRDEFKRHMPGRLVGLSRDADGRPAYRLALQTREQHIRRDKATSNICTSQVLLAVMAGMYAVYHGPDGLRAIARRVHALTALLAAGLNKMGRACGAAPFFDTLRVASDPAQSERVRAAARERRINLRAYPDGALGVALDETTTLDDVRDLLQVFADGAAAPRLEDCAPAVADDLPAGLVRQTPFMTQAVFNRYHTEHEMLRYIRRLEARDLSMTTSMIPLGSCTMKLNAASEMMPISRPEWGGMHPFAPAEQWQGYAELIRQLEQALCAITGFAAASMQPNAGSQGEYAGLLAIRAYHLARGEGHRDTCLIPVSAHGTNPASAVMAGFRVVTVACESNGDIDIADLAAKIAEHQADLGALMVTYPSTHGVFEGAIREVCDRVHAAGGQVYMDGANMNAQVGLTRPADIGADVCHINLHKTFAIPHGGGGPGMGPIAVARHLAPFLPGHPLVACGGAQACGTVSAAPFGSASILPISWMYVHMMGAEGLRRATEIAILNANYMAARLEAHYPVLYKGGRNRVAHEFILDARGFKGA